MSPIIPSQRRKTLESPRPMYYCQPVLMSAPAWLEAGPSGRQFKERKKITNGETFHMSSTTKINKLTSFKGKLNCSPSGPDSIFQRTKAGRRKRQLVMQEVVGSDGMQAANAQWRNGSWFFNLLGRGFFFLYYCLSVRQHEMPSTRRELFIK